MSFETCHFVVETREGQARGTLNILNDFVG